MAKDVMSGSRPRKESRAECGGVTLDYTRDVMRYKPPMGPTNIGDPAGVGLHGQRTHCGTQGPQAGPKGSSSGSPGLGGEVRRRGTQGRY
jgi:hypothetical protein